jgi:N-acetylglucosamine malate deacetylase 2
MIIATKRSSNASKQGPEPADAALATGNAPQPESGAQQAGLGLEQVLNHVCAPPGQARELRSVFVLARPDAESVSAASRLIPLAPQLLIYATNGTSRNGADAHAAGFRSVQAYTHARQSETRSALAHVGISSDRLEFLGYFDHEAAQHLVPLAQAVADRLRRSGADVVLTHPYEGAHPDHDAAAFAVHAAVAMLARTGNAKLPIVEFSSYHPSGSEWVFGQGPASVPMAERIVPLTHSEQALKSRLLACHRTQASILQRVPLEWEAFRLAPSYDFTAPACHQPPLHERYPWGFSTKQWCGLAKTATEQCGLPAARHSPYAR